jgi:hypothetical protein
MKHLIITLIIIIFFAGQLNASGRGHYRNSLSNLYDYSYQKDLLMTGVFLLPVAFMVDNDIQKFAVKEGFYSAEISEWGDFYGHRAGYYTAAGAMAFHSLITKKPMKQSLSELRLMAEGVLAGQLIIETLKTITRRQRPNGGSYRSFPSGHAGGAFGLATTLQTIYGRKIGIPAYLAAGFIASSRINDNKHYFSDVLAGSLIGIWVARAFSKNFSQKYEITPAFDGNQNMLRLTYYF